MSDPQIHASCPFCGEVQLLRTDIDLQFSNDPSLTVYSFTCPNCQQPIRKPADRAAIELLMNVVGIAATLLLVPAEALEPRTGPALTVDDVLDFMLGDLDLAELDVAA